MFNRVKHTRATNALLPVRHSSERETPTPIYVALKIHAITYSRNLIDALFNQGMCISCDRLLNLISNIGNTVCEQYRVDGFVFPPKLRCGVHTSAAVDKLRLQSYFFYSKGFISWNWHITNPVPI